mmetsp:Transcript_104105/g.247751  ORF Transcript_104105/g.247751 Transcript_104105/m.247751 type:complete len:209 (-) Transcript_104105:59-685(-)
MPCIQILPALDHAEEIEELCAELQVVPCQRHLPGQRKLRARPKEVAQCIVLLVVVPLRVLLSGLTDEADVRPVHPRLLITLHVFVAVDDKLHLVRLVGEQESCNGIETRHRVCPTTAIRICEEDAVGDDTVIPEPASEHAGPCVVALGVGRRCAEGSGELAPRIFALCPGIIERSLRSQKCFYFDQLLQRERLRSAKLLQLGLKRLAD